MPLLPRTIETIIKRSIGEGDTEMMSFYLDPKFFSDPFWTNGVHKFITAVQDGTVDPSVLAINIKYGVIQVKTDEFEKQTRKLFREKNMKFINLLINNARKYGLPIHDENLNAYIQGREYSIWRWNPEHTNVVDTGKKSMVGKLQMPQENRNRLSHTFKTRNLRQNILKEGAIRQALETVQGGRELPGIVETIREMANAPALTKPRFPIPYGPRKPAHLVKSTPKKSTNRVPWNPLAKVNTSLFSSEPGAANARKTRRRRN